MAAWARRVATRWYVGLVLMVLHEEMLKAPRDGRSELERRAAGGMGGRPGVARCAVLEGSRVESLCVRLWLPGPGVEPGRAVLPRLPGAEEAAAWLLLLLLAGGEYGGMDSPFETVVW